MGCFIVDVGSLAVYKKSGDLEDECMNVFAKISSKEI